MMNRIFFERVNTLNKTLGVKYLGKILCANGDNHKEILQGITIANTTMLFYPKSSVQINTCLVKNKIYMQKVVVRPITLCASEMCYYKNG